MAHSLIYQKFRKSKKTLDPLPVFLVLSVEVLGECFERTIVIKVAGPVRSER
ncbi:unnamed protein product [Meloidogyne enterolobii]|uniref:Uncharacterized protein n=1 Tax=Meloidogyne enterolobii TaxID=390850 RepID=A0ACB1AXD1_MELEN